MDYRLLLKRTDYFDYGTIGELWIWKLKDNSFPKRFFTLELPKLNNERHISCVIAGTYPIKLRHMIEAKVDHYELQNVPNRKDIFIHSGNTAKDTKGCILVGEKLIQPDILGQYQLVDSHLAIVVIEAYLGQTDSEIMIFDKDNNPC